MFLVPATLPLMYMLAESYNFQTYLCSFYVPCFRSLSNIQHKNVHLYYYCHGALIIVDGIDCYNANNDLLELSSFIEILKQVWERRDWTVFGKVFVFITAVKNSKEEILLLFQRRYLFQRSQVETYFLKFQNDCYSTKSLKRIILQPYNMCVSIDLCSKKKLAQIMEGQRVVLMLNLELVYCSSSCIIFSCLVNLKKMREVLTIEVGQASIQLGNAIWEQYCTEHGIDNGSKRKDGSGNDDSFKVLFEETGSGQFAPFGLVDLETNVIDDVKNGTFAAIFHPEFLVHWKEDAANNFARGHYTIGKQTIDKVNDRLRNLSTIATLLILEKRQKLALRLILHQICRRIVEPYNALLATHWLLHHTEVSLLLDNESIYGICQKQLRIAKPDLDNLNKLIFKVISAVTASLRFSGELNVELNEFQTNLVHFPRLHFMTTGIIPIIPKIDVSTAPNDIQKITDNCFKPANWFVKYTEFDPAKINILLSL
ncbi:tubulin, alpha 3d [Reticulomyxa filosa]|uniref:Tubulin, alpha 3d n=1 Tax=Reticulomyxa filosa TaxID=46433 RepID=X6LBP7_RETFI|nr:tubulin, alpha 3d [Reticulomyxa filosa]|eukprot:ETN98943.1 tubulin, alpha 3d [Reticulomyxa filosa]